MCRFEFVVFPTVSYFSSSHSSSQSSLLNLPNNLIVYQTIFDTIFSNKTKRIFRPLNKTKFSKSSADTATSRTFPQHGLLIDKYLTDSPLDASPSTNSLTWNSFLPYVVLILILVLVYYFRDQLLKAFRERRKRSVLKYSV